jgi:transposase-like protein
MTHFFQREVECPVCGGTNVIKHGKSGEGKQRYLCQDQAYCGKTFIRDYSDLGRLPQIKGVGPLSNVTFMIK